MCTHAYLHTRRTSELVSLRSHEMTVFSIQRLMRDGGELWKSEKCRRSCRAAISSHPLLLTIGERTAQHTPCFPPFSFGGLSYQQTHKAFKVRVFRALCVGKTVMFVGGVESKTSSVETSRQKTTTVHPNMRIFSKREKARDLKHKSKKRGVEVARVFLLKH